VPDAAPSLADLSPMLATARADPFDDPQWLFEPKHDGYRLLAETGRALRLQTRNGHDATAWFPELREPLMRLADGRHILDGEVCVLDAIGRSDFELLHARAKRRGWKPGDPEVVYCVFDVLVHRGRAVLQRPLWERKGLLASMLEQPPPNVLLVGEIAGEGRAMFAAACELRLEGIVAKMRKSTYQPGERSRDWLKIKRPDAVPPERFKRR
jgi:bifunctional non-homologous end joining protein LigD